MVGGEYHDIRNIRFEWGTCPVSLAHSENLEGGVENEPLHK